MDQPLAPKSHLNAPRIGFCWYFLCFLMASMFFLSLLFNWLIINFSPKVPFYIEEAIFCLALPTLIFCYLDHQRMNKTFERSRQHFQEQREQLDKELELSKQKFKKEMEELDKKIEFSHQAMRNILKDNQEKLD